MSLMLHGPELDQVFPKQNIKTQMGGRGRGEGQVVDCFTFHVKTMEK